MGFRLQRRLARLTFVGREDMVGAEVMVRLNISVGDLLTLQELSESKEPKDQLAILQLFSEKVLVSWNLEDDDGKPIPVQDGMTRIPPDIAALIMSGWLEAMGMTPIPLEVKP